jgi:hypothetical protein
VAVSNGAKGSRGVLNLSKGFFQVRCERFQSLRKHCRFRAQHTSPKGGVGTTTTTAAAAAAVTPAVIRATTATGTGELKRSVGLEDTGERIEQQTLENRTGAF